MGPPSAPLNTIPSDVATDIEQDVTLIWLFADNASSYEVYLAAYPNPLQKIAETANTSYGPLNLSAGTLYSWQIVAVNNASSTSGQIWSFTTVTPPVEPPTTSCIDADSDNYCANIEPLDCDDDNPNIYPGHRDKGRWGRDGLDNDCNGVIDG